MSTIIIKNAKIVNENQIFHADVLIENERITKIDSQISLQKAHDEINAENLVLMPGVIDDQVHFREPGLTHKGNIFTESRAAIAGGTTSFIEQPNTVPNAVTHPVLEEKYTIAKEQRKIRDEDSDKPDINYNDNEEFNEWFDEGNKEVIISGLTYRPSEALYYTDFQSYKEALVDYNNRDIEEDEENEEGS
jgi:hypothetical protein